MCVCVCLCLCVARSSTVVDKEKKTSETKRGMASKSNSTAASFGVGTFAIVSAGMLLARMRRSKSKKERKNMPIVVTGPSGAGKGTLIKALEAAAGERIGFCVSHTTRNPRPGEIDGIHYHFVKKEEMEKLISDGKFLEYARVHGNIYGTSIAAMEKVTQQNKICILDIDVQV